MVTGLSSLLPAAMFAGGAIILWIIIYAYSALTVMFTAKKLKTEPAWLAWIPIANLVLLSKMAKKHWWPVLLLAGFIIPFVNFVAAILFIVYMFIWFYKITEQRGYPGWISILIIIPILGNIWGLVLWGMLAWSKK